MAGNYQGDITRMNINDTYGYGTDIQANNLYGVAYESDILVGCGDLSMAYVVDAMTRMGEYAKENDQPLVINFSAGELSGPHDGTDEVSQAIAEVQEKYNAIICVSGGNDATKKLTFDKEFNSDDDVFKTCVTYHGYDRADCTIDIWGDDATPFSIDFNCYKPQTTTAESNTKLFTVNEANQSIKHTHAMSPNATVNPALTEAFAQAEIDAVSEIDPNNNRFHVTARIFYIKSVEAYINIAITGQTGQRVTGTLSRYGNFTAESTTPGSVNGDGKNSINNYACSESVISVGSCNTRQFYTPFKVQLIGDFSSSYKNGGVSDFSSYAKTANGRNLPEVLAPGKYIFSSISPYYLENNEENVTVDDMVGRVTVDDNTYYWGVMSGTSMSSPFAAGTIALWLEADPTLNIFQVREIIGKTSVVDDAIKSETGRYGSGKISAIEGLKEILSRKAYDGIGGINDDESNLILEQSASTIDVFVAGESAIAANIYSTQGALVARAGESGDRLQISTSALAKGIYVLEILPAGGGRTVKKIAIK